MILLRSFLSGHIRIKRTLEYYDAGIGPRVPFGGGFGPTVSANFAVALGDYTTLSTTSSMPDGGLITRAGNAMLYDSTGKLTWAPNNILYPSNNFATGVLWSNNQITPTQDAAPPIGTSNGWSFALTGTAPYSTVGNFQVTQGVKYIISVYVKGVGSSIGKTGQLWFWYAQTATGPASSTTFTYTGDWQRISVSTVPTGSGTLLLRFDPEGTGGTATIGDVVQVFGAQVEQATYQTTPSTYVATTSAAYYGPRFDVDPVTLQNKGLLVEGTRTNLAPYSQAFNSWPGNSNITVGADTSDTTAPDGTNTADKLTRGATTGSEAMARYSNVLSVSTTYTYSVYAKAGSASTYLYIRILGTDSAIPAGLITVDLSNGNATVGSAFSGAVKVTPVANSWYRISVTATTASVFNGTTTFNLYDIGVSGTSTNITGAAGLYLYVWGMQVEVGNFATSYIPNLATGSTARAAETFSIPGYSTNLIEAFYIDEATGGSYSLAYNAGTAPSPSFAWLTSLRPYTNAYAGDITTPSWIDNSGTTGNRMYYDSTGTLTWAPHNQILQSQTFQVTWAASNATVTDNATTAPDGTTTAANVVVGASTAATTISQTALALAASAYIISVYVKKNVGTRYFQLRYASTGASSDYANFDLDTGAVTAGTYAAANITNAGNGWWRIYMLSTNVAAFTSGPTLTFIPASSSARGASYTGNSTDAVYLWGAQLERVTYQTSPRAYIPTTSAAVYQPRYDYDPSVTPATPRGMLIEESRTNFAKYSERFEVSNSLVVSGLSGTFQNGETVTATGGGTGKYLSSGSTSTLILLSGGSGTFTGTLTGGTSGATATISSNTVMWTPRGSTAVTANAIVAPDGTTTADKIVPVSSGATNGVAEENGLCANGRTVSFYAKAGEITSLASSSGAGENTAINLITGVITGNAVYTNLASLYVGNGWWRFSYTCSTAAGFNLYIGPASGVGGSNGFYLWGAQIELGTFPTSYIPTTTASVTRVADVVKLSGSALTVAGAATGSAIVQTTAWLDATGATRYLLASSTSRRLLYSGGSNTGLSSYDGTTILNATFGSGTWTGGPARAAVGWAAPGASLAGNNGTVGTSASINLGTGAAVYLGGSSSSGATGGYWFASMALYNQRLPDTILKAKSVVGSPY